MIGWLIGLGMPEPVARIARWVALGVAILLLGTCAVLRIREDGARDERAKAAAEQAIADAAQRTNERIAEDMRRRELAAERGLSEQRRKEIEDATRDIPDQVLSPRQRATLCVELRRQGASERDLATACGPARAP